MNHVTRGDVPVSEMLLVSAAHSYTPRPYRWWLFGKAADANQERTNRSSRKHVAFVGLKSDLVSFTERPSCRPARSPLPSMFSELLSQGLADFSSVQHYCVFVGETL